jgi:signal transduction histidine kinase
VVTIVSVMPPASARPVVARISRPAAPLVRRSAYADDVGATTPGWPLRSYRRQVPVSTAPEDRRRLPADRWWDVGPAALLLLLTWVGTGAAARNQELPVPDAGAYALASVAALSLLLRRRAPLLALAVCGLAIGGYLLRGYPFGPVLLTGPVAAHAVAARLPWRTAAGAGAGFVLVTTVPHLLDTEAAGWVSRLAWALGWAAVVAGSGAVGAALQVRRRAAEGVRAEQARRAVSEERLAIAREVHDGVGHGLAVIALQAGVALHVLDRDPARARELLASIQATSRESLDGLRAELLRFRGPGAADGPAGLRPAPGLADLPALLARMRDGGLELHTELDECPDVPAEVGAAAHRIVQEALTNVLRHAGDTPAWVTVRCSAGSLLVEVRDRGRGPVGGAPAGLGISGMRERAAAVGGRLEAGAAEDGFVVRAELPLRATAGGRTT